MESAWMFKTVQKLAQKARFEPKCGQGLYAHYPKLAGFLSCQVSSSHCLVKAYLKPPLIQLFHFWNETGVSFQQPRPRPSASYLFKASPVLKAVVTGQQTLGAFSLTAVRWPCEVSWWFQSSFQEQVSPSQKPTPQCALVAGSAEANETTTLSPSAGPGWGPLAGVQHAAILYAFCLGYTHSGDRGSPSAEHLSINTVFCLGKKRLLMLPQCSWLLKCSKHKPPSSHPTPKFWGTKINCTVFSKLQNFLWCLFKTNDPETMVRTFYSVSVLIAEEKLSDCGVF